MRVEVSESWVRRGGGSPEMAARVSWAPLTTLAGLTLCSWGGAQLGPADHPAHPHSLQQGKSSSTGNLLDKEDLALPPLDYGTSSRAFPTQTAGAFKQRPYSVAVPAFSQVSAGPQRGL